MKIIKITFIIAVVTMFFIGCQTAEPIKYSSSENDFSILFPTTPVETKQEIDTDAGKLSFNVVEAKDSGNEYAVTFIDYPDTIVQEKGSNAILEDASNGAIENVYGTLVERNEVTIGTHKGINQVIETVDKRFMSNIFIVENRLYILVIASPKEDFSHELAQDFLNSFELKE